MDDDGILQDEDHCASFPLRRTDSGFGTAERDETRRDAQDEARLDIGRVLSVSASFSGYREDSFPVDDHSLNLSDLDADSKPRSARSSQRSLDCAGRFHSGRVDDALHIGRPRRRHRFTADDDVLSGEGDSSTSDSECNTRHQYHRNDRHRAARRKRHAHRHSERAFPHSDDLSSSRSQSPDRATHDRDFHDTNSADQGSNSLEYLLGGTDDRGVQDNQAELDPMFRAANDDDKDDHKDTNGDVEPHKGSEIEFVNKNGALLEAGAHSLVEFEQLEAGVDSLEEGDLLGAYLQDVTQRDKETEDSVHSDERAAERSGCDDLNDTTEDVPSGQLSENEFFEESEGLEFEAQCDESERSDQVDHDQCSKTVDNMPLHKHIDQGGEDDSDKHRAAEKPAKGSDVGWGCEEVMDPPIPVADANRSRARLKTHGRSLPATPEKRPEARSQSRSLSPAPQSRVKRSSSIPRLESLLGRSASSVPRVGATEVGARRTPSLVGDDPEVASLTQKVECSENFQRHNNKPRPASTGTNLTEPGSKAQVEATNQRHRPGSAKQRRHVYVGRPDAPKSFRMRSQSATNLIPSQQPLRASHTMPGNMAEELRKADQEKRNEETLAQLQEDYTKLLKKYAEAENTIDSLRIGARIPITLEVTGNGNLPAGQQPSPAAAAGSRRHSTASLMSNRPVPAQGKNRTP